MRAYTDVDWAGKIDERKSTSRGALFLGKKVVTWTSKKQSCTSKSTAKVEYVATAINYTKIVWIKQLLKGMKEEITALVILYCDNTSAINISKNLVMHAKIKHIAIKYPYLRNLVEDKEVKMEYVNTKEQIVDIFIKPLPKEAHEYLRGKLGLYPYKRQYK